MLLNISVTIGTTAIMVPLSLAVVSFMPMLSPIKYTTGCTMAIASTVFSRLPLKLSLIMPKSHSILITMSAVTKRQLKRVSALTLSTVSLVNRKLKPNSTLAASVAMQPRSCFVLHVFLSMRTV